MSIGSQVLTYAAPLVLGPACARIAVRNCRVSNRDDIKMHGRSWVGSTNAQQECTV